MRFTTRHLQDGEFDSELTWLSVTVVFALGVSLWVWLGLPLPSCHFHRLTGIACGTCGATRSVSALLTGDVVSAFRFNPLVFAAVCGVVLYNLYAAVVLSLRLPRLRVVAVSRSLGRLCRVTLVVAFLANWAYVVVTL